MKMNVNYAKFVWLLAVITFLFLNTVVNYGAVNDEKSALDNVDEKIILTPKPGAVPRINGPRLFGDRPG